MAEDYIDYVLDGILRVETTEWDEVAAVLEQSEEERQKRLEAELAAIDQQLADRDRIHRDLVDELERQIDRYTDRLDHLYTIGKGRLNGTREHLKDRIRAFYRELRDERRDHWQDRQQLEQERREIQRELAAADEALADLLDRHW